MGLVIMRRKYRDQSSMGLSYGILQNSFRCSVFIVVSCETTKKNFNYRFANSHSYAESTK